MNRRDTYYRQKMQDGELDEIFDLVENADLAQSVDNALIGVHSGESVTQQGAPDLTVQVSAGVATDKLGQRCAIPAPQNLNCAVDENNLTTQVTTLGFEKFLSIFARFVRAESDPRTDGNNDTIQYVQDESFTLRVVQGVEALPNAPRPALDPEDILLADVRLTFGQTQIFNADILVDRREDFFRFTGTDFSTVDGTVGEALTSLATQVDTNSVVVGGTKNLDVVTQAVVLPDAVSGTGVVSLADSNRSLTCLAAATVVKVPIQGLQVGDIINSVTMYWNKADAATGPNRIEEFLHDLTSDNSSTKNSPAAAGAQTVTLNSGDDAVWFPHTVLAGASYYASMESAAGGDKYVAVSVNVDRAIS